MRQSFAAAIVSSLMIIVMAGSLLAAKSPTDRRVVSPLVTRSLHYSLTDELPADVNAVRPLPAHSLGSPALSNSPGASVGVTWYDIQHNGSMGRMIATDGAGGDELVHFSWTYLPSAVFQAREYKYRCYNITDGTLGVATGLQSDDEYAGYVGIDVTGDGRAVVGGHNNEPTDGPYMYDPHFYWDFAAGTGFFGFNSQVTDSVEEWMGYVDQEPIWPKFRYVEGPGPNDTVLHVIAQVSEEIAGDPQAIYYFRRVGSDGVDDTLGTWEYPPYCIDTAYDLSHDVAANDAGKTAIVWTANLPCPGDPDPLASGYECRQFVQYDNDIYYETSNDYGVTWNGRVNVTNNILTEGLEDGYRPYTDLSALIDLAGNLHIVWGARFWPADANQGGDFGLLRSRIFHWSEDLPYLRTVHAADWDQTTCNGGAWQLNTSKMSISECNGRFYVLFVQFNDIPGGVEGDCADQGSPGYPAGSANGELYVTVSTDGGLTWDQARNLTNSRTPGCDSVDGIGGPCDSDHWPSMTRLGRNVPLNPGDTIGEVVVPTGGTDNGWYLDVQYINDHSAGAITKDEGTWQMADVRWFRLACVGPAITPPVPWVWPWEIDYPAWGMHGQQKDTLVFVENNGNSDIVYSVTIWEQTGPTGWLSFSNLGGTLPPGLNNVDTGTIHLNTGGIVDSPGTTVNLIGGLIFEHNGPSSPDTLPISFLVTDNLYAPNWDTLSTTCLSLVALNNGSFGRMGAGNVNMDYVNSGDCDSTADVYLYDGSPVIGWVDGNDTVMNWSIFGTSYLAPYGFVQFGPTEEYNDGVHDVYRATFLTHDSTIMLEKTWYAPQDADTCNFIIQSLRLWSNDGLNHEGLTVGEAIDWDIPADSQVDNGSLFALEPDLMYQYGAEYNQDDTTECQDNDRRYGALMPFGMFKKTDTLAFHSGTGHQLIHGVYTADNATYVFPNTYGFDPGELYGRMQLSGFEAYSTANPDSIYTDLHMVMTFDNDYNLVVGETLVIYTTLITVQNGTVETLHEYAMQSRGWFENHFFSLCTTCCNTDGKRCGLEGGVASLTYIVSYFFHGGPPPSCFDEADCDANGELNIADLTYLVCVLFQGCIPPPCPCQ